MSSSVNAQMEGILEMKELHACCAGAATDDQTAADTNKLSGNVSTGAATFSFIQALPRLPFFSYCLAL